MGLLPAFDAFTFGMRLQVSVCITLLNAAKLFLT